MTPDQADASTGTTPTGTTPTSASDAAPPRLADRLSALVGQAASRQDESLSAERLVGAIAARVDAAAAELREQFAAAQAAQAARMTELESVVADRLTAIEAAVGAQGDDPGMKAHVDEVGGAVVLRLDEVLAGLAEQLQASHTQLVSHAEATRATVAEHAEAAGGGAAASQAALATALDDARHQLATQLEEARGQLAGHVTDSQAHVAGQVEASRVAFEGFEQTLLGHVGDLAAGVVELGERPSLTSADLDASVAGIPALLDGVAQAPQLEKVLDTTTVLRGELTEVAGSLASMRAEFDGLQAAIEKRVDDAALALAETLVAVITSMSSSSGAPSISYDLDDAAPVDAAPVDAAPVDEAADPTVAEGGTDGDWPAADSVEDLEPENEYDAPEAAEPDSESESESEPDVPAASEAALTRESDEQTVGVDEGASLSDTDLGVGALERAFGEPDDAPVRRKGLFRR